MHLIRFIFILFIASTSQRSVSNGSHINSKPNDHDVEDDDNHETGIPNEPVGKLKSGTKKHRGIQVVFF